MNTTKEEIEKRVIHANPDIEEEHLKWRIDKRIEWICECGVGHTLFSADDVFIHGCCGCCEDKEIVESKQLVKTFDNWVSYY